MSLRPPPRPRLANPRAQALPVRYLTQAAAIPGKALAVALAIWLTACALRSPSVLFGRWQRERLSISPDATLDALTRLAAAGLIRTERRRGRYPRVEILDAEAVALLRPTAADDKAA